MAKEELKIMLKEMFKSGELKINIHSEVHAAMDDYDSDSIDSYAEILIDGKSIFLD